MLREETALQATLNPLVEDYGYAVEKLRVQQEMENAATRAGLELTPDRQAAIRQLAEGYAAATVEAARLAESQAEARKTMEDWFGTGRDMMRGFIDDMVEGRSAAEAFGNALNKVGDKLIDMGLAGLFGGGKRGDFGVFGRLFGLPRRAGGGPVRAGQPYIVGEKRPELFVPQQNGMIMPRVPAAGAAGGMHVSIPVTLNAPGADAAGLARLQREVATLQQTLPGIIKQTVARRSKAGW